MTEKLHVMITKLKVNDIVHVDFNNAQYTLCPKAILIQIPTQTGESWIFNDFEKKQLHYVSEGCTVTFIERPKPINEKTSNYHNDLLYDNMSYDDLQ